jgi:geranylgeranyl pyrophosphate synthase
LGPIVEAIENTGGLDYAVGFAQRETAQALAALDALPQTNYSRALAALARFAQERTS